jgi:two-component system chemotaxis response regulator CheB
LVEIAPHIEARIRNAGLLVIGGSAGSFVLIQQLVNALPGDFAMPVVVVLHRGRQYKSVLEALLQQHSSVKVKEAEDKEVLEAGKVYIAPADYHLLVEDDHSVSLDVSEPVWFCRPSIDVVFESAVDIYRQEVIGVLFSGANEDGANGIAAIRNAGGVTFVQDPDDAEFRVMPEAAITKKAADIIFKGADIIPMIRQIQMLKKNVQ